MKVLNEQEYCTKASQKHKIESGSEEGSGNQDEDEYLSKWMPDDFMIF